MKFPTSAERDELIALVQRVAEVQADLKAALEATAERCGVSVAPLRRWVRALARDEAEATRDEAQQVLDLFEAESEGLLPLARQGRGQVTFEPGVIAGHG